LEVARACARIFVHVHVGASRIGDPLSKWIRQIHRWLSIAFTITVIGNFVALAQTGGQMPPPWVTYSPLLPLALLMFSGLYLFALPYAAKWRAGRRAV
jgi:hypothetical protein